MVGAEFGRGGGDGVRVLQVEDVIPRRCNLRLTSEMHYANEDTEYSGGDSLARG